MLGALLDSRYRINRLIGRGGVGVVYHATDRSTEREVVIKILAPNWVGNAEILARFDREVERLSGLQHANIVSLLGFGRHDGRTFMVMEYIEGELLRSYLARRGRLPLEDFVPIASQILKGMSYAHSRGLMHRDLNPANIMLCIREGRANFVKILDFGLAKLKEGEAKVTEQHELVGTAGFLAPEQIKGEDVDLRVDVYALGVMFYQMLSGRMPFEGEHNATLLYKHVHEPPTPLADLLPPDHDVPEHLIRLIHDCLEKSPDQRPEDSNELVEDLIDCVPAALFRLPDASMSDLEIIREDSGATMVGLGIGGAPPPMPPMPTVGAWPTVGRRGGPPKPILVQEPDDDEAADETVAAEGIGGPVTEVGRASFDSSTPTLRESASLLDEGIEASTSALPPRAYTPQAHSLSAAPVEAPRGKSSTLLIGASLALILGAGVAYLILSDRGEVPAAKTVMDEAGVRAALDRAEEAVAAGEFAKATREMDAVKAFVAGFPIEQARADRISESIVVGQLLGTARKLEGEGNSGAAISAFKDVLTRDPTNAEARQALARLTTDETSEESESSVGSVVVVSTPSADLTIDGASFGTTPYSGQLSVGKHVVRLEARGHEPWESTIEVRADKNPDFRITMRAKGRPGVKSDGGGKPPADAGKPPADGGKPPADGGQTGTGQPEPPKDGGGKDDGIFLPTKKDKDSGIFLPVGGK